ncbi:MAG: hypothetical protein ABL933_00795 [Methyloglobulus sp.]|nr:hypothetical protein [Methyloglobulus sp.]
MNKTHQQALQLIQNGEWNAAHRLVQDYSDPLSCQIHGYLHRIEGDLSNARYWYQRAGLAIPDNSQGEELKRLLTQLTDIAE